MKDIATQASHVAYSLFMKASAILGIASGYIFLTLVYIFCIGAYSILYFCMKVFRRTANPSTYWQPKAYVEPLQKNLSQQF